MTRQTGGRVMTPAAHELPMLNTLTESTPKSGAAIVSLKSPTRRAAEWLAAKIEQGKKEPFTEIITLTPEIAEALLANNPNNRTLRMSLISAIAADITAGKWDLNGETIIVSKTGELNDGQNRCHAILEAKKSVRTAIMFGVDRDSRYTVDMGVSRQASDFLAMEGAKNAVVAAAIARGLKCHESGFDSWNSGNLVTRPMVRQKYWDLEKQIQAAVVVTGHPVFKRFSWPACGVAYVLIRKRNAAEAEVFFARLQDGVGLRSGNPILALRNRMMHYDQKKDRLKAPEKCAMIIRYWNAYRSGQSVSQKLQVPRSIPKVEA